ncbi:AraC family transcriptional regulator [Paenibacillus marchantiophytorum]|uniref:AraC family transcriptional regulator n=1 Tax=Paenibacillus marchantiophytorum TaxID=1619310 RepID=A0ABQ2BRJ1_9BACL|nr:AraC family transcriptional regulator [Paenibacillus marchantiophytorum]
MNIIYRIIIVDDEIEVREGIKESIEWERHGFECIGDYRNGKEALEAIAEFRPDLVLSDICMPFMDGIELTRQIQLKYPYIKVIILTGHDEFDYAQQALRLKVHDFVVKPITANEIRSLLDRVKAEMDKEAESRENLSHLKMQLHQSLPLLRERFLEQLMSGTLSERKIMERFHYFGLPLIEPPYLVVAIDIDNLDEVKKERWQNDPELFRSAAYNIVQEVVESKEAIVFRTREERMVVLFYGDSGNELDEAALNLSEVMRFCMEKYLKCTVTVGVGTMCRALHELPLSYKGAISALDYRFMLGNNRVISIQDMEGGNKPAQQLDMEWNRKFSTVIKTGTFGETQALIEQLISCLKASLMPMGGCYLQVQSIIISIMNTIHEFEGNHSNHFKGYDIAQKEINQFKTLEEIEEWLKTICKEAILFVAEQRSDQTKMQVLSVIDYIEKHYVNENLSVDELCRHVHMSKSYFSSVFKQNKEQTIMEYVTRVRIDKAKDLLNQTSLKSYEVALKVGYSDPQYFSVLFKKHTGTTPTEYRDKLLKEK